MSLLTLIPAYGRSYAHQEHMMLDWNSGKDFRIVEMGCYCSNRDLENMYNEFNVTVLKMCMNTLQNHFVLNFIEEKDFAEINGYYDLALRPARD